MTVCCLESDPDIRKSFLNEQLTLTATTADGQPVVASVKELGTSTPSPVKKSLRQRLINGQLQFIEVVEKSGLERGWVDPNNRWHPGIRPVGLKYRMRLGLSTRPGEGVWEAYIDPEEAKHVAPSQRLFRDQDGDGKIIIPRRDIPKKRGD